MKALKILGIVLCVLTALVWIFSIVWVAYGMITPKIVSCYDKHDNVIIGQSCIDKVNLNYKLSIDLSILGFVMGLIGTMLIVFNLEKDEEEKSYY